MSEYRVMHLDNAYQIQQKHYGKWEKIGEFDDLKNAKKFLAELKKGTICD